MFTHLTSFDHFYNKYNIVFCNSHMRMYICICMYITRDKMFTDLLIYTADQENNISKFTIGTL